MISYAPPPDIGVGDGWQRRCKAWQSLGDLDNEGTFFFFAITLMAIELDHSCGVENFTPRKGNDRIICRSACGKALSRQLHSTPIVVSGSTHTGNLINALKLSSMCKSALQAVLSRMQLTLHATRRPPHGASHLVQALYA